MAEFDLEVRNRRVIDETRTPGRTADVAITPGLIWANSGYKLR